MLPERLYQNLENEVKTPVPLPDSTLKVLDAIREEFAGERTLTDIVAAYAHLGWLVQQKVRDSEIPPDVYKSMSINKRRAVDLHIRPDGLEETGPLPSTVLLVPMAAEIQSDMVELKKLYKYKSPSEVMQQLIKIGMAFHSEVLEGSIHPGTYGGIVVSDNRSIIPPD
jgi:hypothetical protein